MKKTARSGCKLNWYLKVTGKRADGYHDLVTLFQYLPFPSDIIELELESAPGIRAVCSDSRLPQDLDNLAGKAAAAYAHAAGITPAWHIFIEKGIPAAAGLGGGSADAGTVLRLLEEHYQALGKEKLIRLAAQLGADVPFFLEPGLVLAEGIGEKMTALEAAPLPDLLIVNPGFPVSAKWAYTHLAKERIGFPAENGAEKILKALEGRDMKTLGENMHNDLEYALYEKFPLLEIIRKELYACGAVKVLVSGSGSSLFALFDSSPVRRQAAGAVRKLLESDPVCRIFELGDDCIYA